MGVDWRCSLLSEQSICTILQVVGSTPNTKSTVLLVLGFQYYSLLLGASVTWCDNPLEWIPPTSKAVRCPCASGISRGLRGTLSWALLFCLYFLCVASGDNLLNRSQSPTQNGRSPAQRHLPPHGICSKSESYWSLS